MITFNMSFNQSTEDIEIQFLLGEEFSVEFEQSSSTFSFDLEMSYSGFSLQYYDGDYEVTPSASNVRVLNTTHMFLRENVRVNTVPYYETSNETGETVYIASEVN